MNKLDNPMTTLHYEPDNREFSVGGCVSLSELFLKEDLWRDHQEPDVVSRRKMYFNGKYKKGGRVG